MHYPGQGREVPPGLGVGVWIEEGRTLFSFDERAVLAAIRRLPSTGEPVVAFSAALVGHRLVVSVDELVLANRHGQIDVGQWELPPERPGAMAMRFRIQYGERKIEITLGLSQC